MIQKTSVAIVAVLYLYCSLVESLTLQQVQPEVDKPTPSCSLNQWQSFKEKFSKNYSDKPVDEDKKRLAIFCENLQRILEHNANPENTYKMGLNHLSDLTPEERIQMTGLRQTDITSKMNTINGESLKRMIPNLNEEPPSSVDWSLDPSRVSPARNQGDCGSCWAFTAVALIEGQEKPTNGSALVDLSEQNLVDCDEKNSGCNGGSYPKAFDEIRRNGGVMTRADYPYVSGLTGRKGKCKMVASNAYITTKHLGATQLLQSNNETLLKQVVAFYGPVAAAIHAPTEFETYSGGIFNHPDCEKKVNHGLAIIGYGTDQSSGLDYWKVKNSWSKHWGRDGFGYLCRNCKQYGCMIASSPYILVK